MKLFFLSLLLAFMMPLTALNLEQEAVVTYVEILLINYLEYKFKDPNEIKDKVRQIINRTNDPQILGYVYEIVSGLTLIYDDEFTKELQIRLEEWERHTHLSLSDILRQSHSDHKPNN